MHKAQLYIIPFIMGVLCGLLAMVLWGLFWTLVIPWPAHGIFSGIVATLAGFGAIVWTVNGMLRWSR